jgi:sugar/nucleoside kinase (ribokinase family)
MIRGNILTVGLSTIDLRISTPYSTGGDKRKLESEKYKFSAGGMGATTAIGISRLGWGSMFCTAIGDDMFGSIFGRIFADEKVESRFIKKCRTEQTSMNFSFENKSGEIYVPSSSRFINSSDVESAFNVIPDAVITTLELPHEVVSTACRCACTQNSKFILDATGTRDGMELSFLKNVDVLVLGAKELSALTGNDVRTSDDRTKGCISLYSKIDAKFIVVDMEENGYHLFDGKFSHFIMPWDVPRVSSDGCREAFLSAMTISYLRTDDIKASVNLGAAAAALAGGREGGFESLPTEREIRDLMKK